jgi:hypothetical protein
MKVSSVAITVLLVASLARVTGCSGGNTSPLSIQGDSGTTSGNSRSEAGAGAGAGSDGGAGRSADPQAVSMFALIGDVPACAAGYAHPNACCQRGACLEDPSDPFAACDKTSLTFPDRRTCCALADGNACIAASNMDAGIDGAATAPCSLPCGPEGYPAGETQFSACSNPPSAISCVYCCSGLGCPSDECNCPAQFEGSPPCACNTPRCSQCPDGWQAVQASQVDLCCRAGASGSTECFSQSGQVEAPAEGSAMTSGPNGCDAYQSANGHFKEVFCDTTMTPQCTCSLDGIITQTSAVIDGCSFSICDSP